MEPVEVFAYLRVSSTGQARDSRDGFTRQEETIRTYCNKHAMRVVDIFREDISGTELDRPTLAQMMVSLEQNHHGVRTVIVEKLDRLARDLMVQEAIVNDFQTKGVKLVSALEGEDLLSDDPTRCLVRQMFGAIAEYEKRMLVAKLRAARDRRRRRTGRCEGRPGYRDTPEGQALAKYIRTIRITPLLETGRRPTLQAVADRLNAEGHVTSTGRPWTVERVQQIVNPTDQTEKNRRRRERKLKRS